MIFKEFGDKKKPPVILIHGGALSWWTWKAQIETLQEEYYIVTPIIEGHGEAYDIPFISIEESAHKIVTYIKENFKGKVHTICGFSIGAQILVQILSEESEITEHAVIESALVYSMRKRTAAVLPMYRICYGLIKKRWFAKIQARQLYIRDEIFERYYKESSMMTKKSLVNIVKSNGNYDMPAGLSKSKAKTLIIVGEKELSIIRKSAELLKDTISRSYLVVIEKSRHGEISLNYSKEYIDLIEEWLWKVRGNLKQHTSYKKLKK